MLNKQGKTIGIVIFWDLGTLEIRKKIVRRRFMSVMLVHPEKVIEVTLIVREIERIVYFGDNTFLPNQFLSFY
jgi:hypothetical protein